MVNYRFKVRLSPCTAVAFRSKQPETAEVGVTLLQGKDPTACHHLRGAELATVLGRRPVKGLTLF